MSSSKLRFKFFAENNSSRFEAFILMKISRLSLTSLFFFVSVSSLLAVEGMVFPPGVEHQVLFRRQEDGYNNIRIPSLCTTKTGALLAFAEGRTGGDAGKIEMILRRSDDGGQTWGAIQKIWADAENTCGNPTPVCDDATGNIWLFGTWNLGADHESKILDGKSEFPRIPHVLKSDDDGKTWSRPEPMSHLRKDDWAWYATGPCNAIQLTRGPCKGRLVVPANHSVRNEGDKGAERYHSHLIYSDDHGKTWELGAVAGPLTNESTVVELEDGGIMQNMRSYHGQGCRAVAVSRDGGTSYPERNRDDGTVDGDAYLDHALQTPVCQASILRYSWARGDEPGTILFTSPWGKNRAKLAVWASQDDGQSWSEPKVVFDGPAAYSNLVALSDNRVGILCEIGLKDPYQTISFLSFPLEWVLLTRR